MNFYARAKPGGRTYKRRLYDSVTVTNPYHHINVMSEMKKDLRMWVSLLNAPNLSVPFVEVLEIPSEDMGFYTDASGGKGWGAYLAGKWLYGCWTRGFVQKYKLSTAWMELYAVVVAVVAWKEYFSGKRVLIHCDNTAAVAMVNDQTTPD